MDIWCTFQSQTEYSSFGAKVFAEFGGNNYTILFPIMGHNPQKSSKKWTLQIVHQAVQDLSSWPDSSRKPFNMELRIFA